MPLGRVGGAGNFFVFRPAILAIARCLFFSLSQLPSIAAAPLASHVPLLHLLADEPEAKDPDDPSLWLYLGIAAVLVLLGGAFAGLTIALMGQDEIYLQVIKTSGEGAEKKHAAKVLRLLSKGKHWVLVTLLLSNVITNETLPIVLDRSLGGGWPAVLGSTVLIVIFGEVVPQSICVRFGLPIGAWMSPFVLALMYIMSPVAWPTAKLLDRLLGEEHGTVYKKAGLKTLVTLHKTMGEAGEQLNSDEVTIISAVLDLKAKHIGSIMTPMEDVFTMSTDDVLDEETMDLLLSQGYSRVPIHAAGNPYDFVGMLLVKMLITYDPEDCKRVSDFALATLPETRPETSCLDIVNFFQEGKSHMVLVSDFPAEDHGALGVVTLEDVIEELIGEEIVDESDVFIDVHKAIRRMAPAPKARVPRGKIVDATGSEMKESETDLIDISENEPASQSDVDRKRLAPRKSSINSNSGVTPRQTFTLRRGSGGHDNVTQRGDASEIREHLKHLGPSNVASRPRTTRYASVKIKQGSSGLSSSVPHEMPRRDDAHTGGIGAGLLDNAGRVASDGVQALQAVIGSPNSRTKSPDTSNKAVQASQSEFLDQAPNSGNGISTIQEEPTDADKNGTRPELKRNIPSTTSSSSSTRSLSTIRSLNTRTPGTYLHRGPARSGSITEQVVDMNGVRKVVLETTSSSDDVDGDTSPVIGENEVTEGWKNGKAGLRGGDHGKDGDAQNSADEDTEGGSSRLNPFSSSKKKRRRKRKGKASGNGETEPLLKK